MKKHARTHLPRRIIAILFVLAGNTAYTQQIAIVGEVVDSLDRQSLGYAAIAVYLAADSTQIGGTLSDSTGIFRLAVPPAKLAYLEVRYLGYQPFILPLPDLTQGTEINLGKIGLSPSSRLLEEIEITGKKRRSYTQIDRQVFDAGQFQQAQGGNVTDILRNLPGVSVNAQGEISLRGSQGFLLMIDGRQIQGDPLTLLNQLPANGIQHIEVLTTPSAKYDPDGAAGIIHITTRRGATDGMYVLVNGLLGAPSIASYDNAEASRRYGGDITFNYIRGNWDLSAGVDYHRDDLAGQRIGYVNTYLDEVLTEYPSYGERSFDRERYSLRLSAVNRINPRHLLSMSFLAGDRTQWRTADILYAPQQRTRIAQQDFLGTDAYWDLYQATEGVFQAGTPLNRLTYYNENLRVRRGDFLIGGVDYSWKWDEQQTLSLSALYERTLLGGPTDNTSLAWPGLTDTLQYQYNTNDNPLDGFRLKADYIRKLGKASWESGYQYRFLYHPGDFLYLDRDLENDRWIENPVFSNRIELRREIHSIYSQLSGNWRQLQWAAGIRLEYMDRKVGLDQPDTTYTYQIFQPFPTLNLQYDLGDSWALKGGYSRRIERTTTFKMTPFPEREHNETLEQGDASLLPEFIDLAELGMVKSWGDNSVFATGYYRHIQNVINRVNTVYNDSILNRIYTNAGTAQALGLELGGTLYPSPWLEVYLGGNLYRYRIKGTLFGDEINTSNLIYSLNANVQVDLTPTLNLQAGFNFLSERVTAQGVDSRFYNPSLTLKQTFLKGKLAATLQWLSIDMDLLSSNEQRITTSRDNFFTTTNYVYEVDRVILTLGYRLNQPSKQMKFIESEFGEKEY